MLGASTGPLLPEADGFREKIGIARTSKQPAWSQPFLAGKIRDRLQDHPAYIDKSPDYWDNRIKDIESRRDPKPFEIAIISEVLGTDYAWQSTEDDLPIRWRSEYDQAGKQSSKDVVREKREVPYMGYVPSYGWKRPTGDTEKVPTTYEGDDASELSAYRVRLDLNYPRFHPGTLILYKPHGVFMPGLYNFALSPDGELQLGKIRIDGNAVFMDFANQQHSSKDVTGWECLGYAKHQEETKDEGLS